MSKGLKYTLYGILLLDILGLFLAYVFAETVCCDEFEHLRMSYLVGNGYIPYRDFFEHHHPLLWYVFAPIMMILPHDFTLTYYTARFISFVFSSATFYFVYLIFRDFFSDKKLFVYFFLTVMVFYPIWYGFSFFKPDVYSRFFYISGLYYFMCYIKNTDMKDLMICGLSFSVSFLFLQTVLFDILPLILISGVIIYKNPQSYKDFMVAAIPSIILLLMAIIFLFYTNSLEQYFQLNWEFNRKVLMGDSKYILKDSIIYYFFIHFAGGLAALFWLYKNKKLNKYSIVIALLFICSIVQHVYLPAYYAHYLILPFIFCSMITAFALEYLFDRKEYKILTYYIAAFLFCSLILNFITLYIKNDVLIMAEMKKINSTGEKIMVISGNLYKIYDLPASYYVMHSSITMADNELFNRFPEYDINDNIVKYNPLYLDYDDSDDWFVKLKNKRYKISEETLQNYEKISRYLWQRKDTLYQ